MSYGRLCDLENEKGSNPTVMTLDKLASFYGVSIDDLLRAALKSIRSKKKGEGNVL